MCSLPPTNPLAPGLQVESVDRDGRRVALVVRAAGRPAGSAFVSDPADSFQLGFIVSPAGREIPRHVHPAPTRAATHTAEVVVVESGRCEVDVYDDDRTFLATVGLGPGDVVVLLRGGHAFRMTEDTVLIDVKQGPYSGPDAKVPF